MMAISQLIRSLASSQAVQGRKCLQLRPNRASVRLIKGPEKEEIEVDVIDHPIGILDQGVIVIVRITEVKSPVAEVDQEIDQLATETPGVTSIAKAAVRVTNPTTRTSVASRIRCSSAVWTTNSVMKISNAISKTMGR